MQYKRHGFTLIELAIVLVIIGLIVGGILVGREMIETAKLRQTVTQIEKFTTAVNTFRGKYTGLPGDLQASLAAQFNMTARSGAAGHGDGNGMLEGCSAAAAATASVAGCETVLFWRDLSDANMIAENFVTATDTLLAVPTGTVDQVFPKAKTGNDAYYIVYHENGINYYQLTGLGYTDGVGVYHLQNAFTPVEMYGIDSKIDDGLPFSGKVIVTFGPFGRGGSFPPDTTTMGIGVGACSTSYDFSQPDSATCSGLRIRMQ